MKIAKIDNEHWWLGYVGKGYEMPYLSKDGLSLDLVGGNADDQLSSLMISDKGRYIWSDYEFKVDFKENEIEISGDGNFDVKDGLSNLKGAYLSLMNEHFKFDGNMPDPLFFKQTQYNTWMELNFNQTEESIIEYAKTIIDNGLKPGILMIDGGWQEDYGVFEFNRRKIPNPNNLIDTLHKLGFKVMVWVSPIVSSAGYNFKMLRKKGYLICDKDSEPAIRKWWSGYSCVLDLSNPEAVGWYHEQLNSLIERYNIDGFKFDAGDKYFYDDNDKIYASSLSRNQTTNYNKIGEKYKFNEYRACWNSGGKGIVARLQDKEHTWDEVGIKALIPNTILQGLCGYAYCCPDMVGGGAEGSVNDNTIDEELFVRWAQVNAMMGMMQISVAPWRVLNKEANKLVMEAIKLHEEYAELFYELAVNASKSGEPIIRNLEYEFPHQGLHNVKDEYMVGSEILVAPVVEKGVTSRKVILPSGCKWQDKNGTIFNGGNEITVDAPLNYIPIFKRV